MTNDDSNDSLLCLFDQSIGLERLLSKYETLAWKLEESIESCLDHDVSDAPVVHIGDRHDAHWLKCRKPFVPPQTILGIWEEAIVPNQEEEEDSINPPIILDIFQSSVGESNKHECSCVAPHSEWTRTQLLPSNNGDASSERPIHVKWVDIRQWQKQQGTKNNALENPASLCHFTRSLLNCSHSASPWVTTKNEQDPDVVALVMMRRYLQALSSFRVGDASPSYFLHSTSQLELVPNQADWMVSGNAARCDEMEEAILLVFRRLPPRENLSVQHPLNKEAFRSGEDTAIPHGCLWETYQLKVDNGDGDDEEEPETFYRLLGPPYVSRQQDYPALLEPLLYKQNIEVIRAEAMSIPKWTAWPEKVHYASDDGPASWTVFPLCHCFPADIVENRKWLESTCSFVPQTTALLKTVLGTTLRTALFSRLNPQATLEAHTGWKDLANHVYRVHLPLVVPPGGLCGTWVDGCVETHEEGRFICFDDAKVHRAFNYSSQDRIVLILDLARPEALPAGSATGGHTDELDSFIQQLT